MPATRQMLGENHPDTLESMTSLANKYSKLGRQKEANQLGELVLAIKLKTAHK